MTAVSDAPKVVAPTPTLGQQVVRILTTTDHKLIGKMYLVTSFGFFMVRLIWKELFEPSRTAAKIRRQLERGRALRVA